MTVKIELRMPSVSEFMTLRSDVSWGVPTAAHSRDALASSLDGIVATVDGEVIGMARTVGDGVLNAYIQDVIVAQSFQTQGIGRMLVSALISKLQETCPPSCLIGLFAAEGQDIFYTRFGFTARPQTGFGPGMHATLSNLMHFLSNNTATTSENGELSPISDAELTGIALAKSRSEA